MNAVPTTRNAAWDFYGTMASTPGPRGPGRTGSLRRDR